MKFFRMHNGDIITSLRPIVGKSEHLGIKATRVYENERQRYCFDERIYFEGIKSQLNAAQATVLRNQISGILGGEIFTTTGDILEPLTKELGRIKQMMSRAKEAIHDYTA